MYFFVQSYGILNISLMSVILFPFLKLKLQALFYDFLKPKLQALFYDLLYPLNNACFYVSCGSEFRLRILKAIT